MSFLPYANESDSLAIGELTIENHVDRLSLYGELTLTRDKPGLALALALQKIVDAAVQTLQNGPLPEKIANNATSRRKNPF